MNKSILLASIAFTLTIPSIATAQNRANTKDKSKPSLSVQAPASDKELEKFSCHLKGVQMTASGLGYFCVHKQGNSYTDYLVVSDGGSQPGGVSAGMSLLISITEANKGAKAMITNRVKSANKKAQRICDLIQGPQGRRNDVECREAISFGWHLSSAISTGSAEPGPNIPTRPANPNGPNIPTRPAGQN